MKSSEEYKEKGKERRRVRYENNKEESWGRMKRWIEEHPERVKELHKEQARKYREKLENDPELIFLKFLLELDHTMFNIETKKFFFFERKEIHTTLLSIFYT